MSLGLHLGLRLGAGAVGAFSPASLFAAGEQGVWYDPSDFSTMYQESTGVTPVTAVGQSVGLLLDKSQGLVLGPELLGNPSFDSAANYSLIAGATISGGQLFLDNQTNSRAEGTGNFLPTGKILQVEVDVAANSGSFAIVLADAGGALTIVGPTFSGTGIQRGLVFSGATNGNFRIIRTAGSATLNSISFKVLAGNHATQSNVSLRPILGRNPLVGTRNLLTRTEDLSNAVWNKSSLTSSGSLALVEDTSSSVKFARQIGFATIVAGATYSFSFKAKRGVGSRNIVVNFSNAPTNNTGVNIDLGSGSIVAAHSGITASIQPADDGFFYVSGTYTGNGTTAGYRFDVVPNSHTGTSGVSYTGDGVSSIQIKETQFETGSTATAYQKVTTAFDVTEAGVADCYYLSFDGSDDFLVTGNIDFSATDEMTVIAGVRKLSDAARGMIAELSVNAGTNAGAFLMDGPGATPASESYRYVNAGTLFGTANAGSGYAAPSTNILTGIGDISTDTAVLRVDGVQVASSAADQGTGNFGAAYPLYIGRRGGTTLPFNGQLYSLIVRGLTTAGGILTSTETYVNSKTGAY